MTPHTSQFDMSTDEAVLISAAVTTNLKANDYKNIVNLQTEAYDNTET